jgi:hypothetical protein
LANWTGSDFISYELFEFRPVKDLLYFVESNLDARMTPKHGRVESLEYLILEVRMRPNIEFAFIPENSRLHSVILVTGGIDS